MFIYKVLYLFWNLHDPNLCYSAKEKLIILTNICVVIVPTDY